MAGSRGGEGVRSDRTDETFFNRHADEASHGNLATEERGHGRVFGVEEATAIVGGALRGAEPPTAGMTTGSKNASRCSASRWYESTLTLMALRTQRWRLD